LPRACPECVEHALERLTRPGHPGAKWGVKVQTWDARNDEWSDNMIATEILLDHTGNIDTREQAQHEAQKRDAILEVCGVTTIRHTVMEVWVY
jgi:hypothetical protein